MVGASSPHAPSDKGRGAARGEERGAGNREWGRGGQEDADNGPPRAAAGGRRRRGGRSKAARAEPPHSERHGNAPRRPESTQKAHARRDSRRRGAGLSRRRTGVPGLVG